MKKERILIVEDQKELQELLRYNLEKEGFQALSAESGQEAERLARTESPELVVLDLALPDIDGLSICKTLRSHPQTRATPIIMLTARGEEADIVRGLEAGADDYVTKPFSPRVLLARIRAALRRVEGPSEQGSIRIGDLSLHPGRCEVRFGSQDLDLTRTQFRILHLLMRRPGWVFTRYQIVDGIQHQGYDVTERSVDVQIVGLRKRLGRASRYIETVRGVGYRFRDE